MTTEELNPEWLDIIPEKENMKQGVLYISRKYKTASHLCPCGCGNEIVTPVNSEGSNAWNMTETNGKVSLSPSIGSSWQPCKSHYFITENKIVPC